MIAPESSPHQHGELPSFVSAPTKEDGNALWDHYGRLSDRMERSIKRYKLAVESSNRSRMRETRRKLRKALDMLDSVRRTLKTTIKSELKQQLGARRRLQQAADKAREVANEVTERARAAKKKWLEAKKARANAAALYHAAKVALQTEPSSSEHLSKKSETKQAAKRANAAYQTALTDLRTVRGKMKSALKEATKRETERAWNTREARRNQERLADIRKVSSSTTETHDQCDGPQDCPTLPNTRCIYTAKYHILKCENGCSNEPCRSKGAAFECRAKVREEGGDGLPYECVDVCAANGHPCAGEQLNTECYADNATHPTVAKCRNPCLPNSGTGFQMCHSYVDGDKFACLPKQPYGDDTHYQGLPFKCTNQCPCSKTKCDEVGTDLSECYVDHYAQPVAEMSCRNPCLSMGRNSASQQCLSIGPSFGCRPRSRSLGGGVFCHANPFECVDLCASSTQ